MRADEVCFERSVPTIWKTYVYRFGSECGSECFGRVGHEFLYTSLDLLEVGQKDPKNKLLCGEER